MDYYEHNDGPNRKVYDSEKNGKSQRRCVECNKLWPKSEMTVYYEDGTKGRLPSLLPFRTKILESLSVDKRKNWELVESKTITVRTGGASFTKQGNTIKGEESVQNNNKSKDGRQLKKKIRQEKARQQKGARAGHAPSQKAKNTNKLELSEGEEDEQEEIVSAEEVEEDAESSEELGNGKKIKSIVQGENEVVMARAKILCRNCTCYAFSREKNTRDKARKEAKAEAEYFY